MRWRDEQGQPHSRVVGRKSDAVRRSTRSSSAPSGSATRRPDRQRRPGRDARRVRQDLVEPLRDPLPRRATRSSTTPRCSMSTSSRAIGQRPLRRSPPRRSGSCAPTWQGRRRRLRNPQDARHAPEHAAARRRVAAGSTATPRKLVRKPSQRRTHVDPAAPAASTSRRSASAPARRGPAPRRRADRRPRLRRTAPRRSARAALARHRRAHDPRRALGRVREAQDRPRPARPAPSGCWHRSPRRSTTGSASTSRAHA